MAVVDTQSTPLGSWSDRLLNLLLAVAVFAGVWIESVFRGAPFPGVPVGDDDDDRAREGIAGFDDPLWHEWGEHGAGVPFAALAAVALPAAVAVLVRQRWPIPAVLFAGTASLVGLLVFGIPIAATLAFAVVLYSVAVERGWRAAAIPTVAALISMVIVAGDDVDEVGPALVLAVLAALVTPLLAAAATRSRRAYLQAMRQQLLRSKSEQAARTEQALAQERVKLAHDLHDVLAHSLTVVNMQVGVAAHLLHDHPDRAEVALGEAQVAGTVAIAELRNTLAILRGADSDQLAPQPTMADLNTLFSGVKGTGMPLSTRLDFDPDSLPAGLSLIGYRTIQEGLTNVVKHAGPRTPTTVEVTESDHRLSISIRNDAGTAQPSHSPGIGLEGLRTRIASLGGSFHAGPTPQGGWTLDVTVPVGTETNTTHEEQV